MMQRTGAEIFLLQLNLLPAADLERGSVPLRGVKPLARMP